MAYYYAHPAMAPPPPGMAMGPLMPMGMAPVPPPIYAPPHQTRYTVWLMPLIFLVEIGLFIYTMYENNCPQHRGHNHDECVLEDPLGRFSFEPYSENRLIGPSSATLLKMGALTADLVYRGQYGRLFSCMWLHGGVVTLLFNMTGVLIFGNRFETDFGFWRVGPLYVISGVGGSFMSVLQLVEKENSHHTITVGAAGALFGLLGASLSELMTNWSLYGDKCLQLFSILLVIGLNVAIGFVNPWVDWAAHIGGFATGYLLGFVLLIRPQPGYISRKYLPPGYHNVSRHKCYQYIFFLLGLISFLALFAFFVSS